MDEISTEEYYHRKNLLAQRIKDEHILANYRWRFILEESRGSARLEMVNGSAKEFRKMFDMVDPARPHHDSFFVGFRWSKRSTPLIWLDAKTQPVVIIFKDWYQFNGFVKEWDVSCIDYREIDKMLIKAENRLRHLRKMSSVIKGMHNAE